MAKEAIRPLRSTDFPDEVSEHESNLKETRRRRPSYLGLQLKADSLASNAPVGTATPPRRGVVAPQTDSNPFEARTPAPELSLLDSSSGSRPLPTCHTILWLGSSARSFIWRHLNATITHTLLIFYDTVEDYRHVFGALGRPSGLPTAKLACDFLASLSSYSK